MPLQPVIKEDQIQTLKKSAGVVRALNHNLRRSILDVIIANDNWISVTDIYTKLGIEQSIASNQLKILKGVKAVMTTRESKYIYYSVDKGRISEIISYCEALNK